MIKRLICFLNTCILTLLGYQIKSIHIYWVITMYKALGSALEEGRGVHFRPCLQFSEYATQKWNQQERGKKSRDLSKPFLRGLKIILGRPQGSWDHSSLSPFSSGTILFSRSHSKTDALHNSSNHRFPWEKKLGWPSHPNLQKANQTNLASSELSNGWNRGIKGELELRFHSICPQITKKNALVSLSSVLVLFWHRLC